MTASARPRRQPLAQPDLFAAPAGLPRGSAIAPMSSPPRGGGARASLARSRSSRSTFRVSRQPPGGELRLRYDYRRRAVVEAAPFPPFSFPAAQDRRRLRPAGGRVPPGPHQRISTRRGDRLASRQGAVRRGGRRVAACAVQLALSPQGGREMGARVAHRRAALGLSALGPGPQRSGSTAFRRSTAFAIRSPCGRSLLA